MPCFLAANSPFPPQHKKQHHPHFLIRSPSTPAWMQDCGCCKAIKPQLPPASSASVGRGAQARARTNTPLMGNVASGRRRPAAVEERLTRPRRLLRELPDMDAGRMRHLIRRGDLAPCFDAAEDAVDGQAEECPICFYFYPRLNRSKCCGKGICTECFLQLMPSKTSKAVHCPFCKTKSYAIEYRGARTSKKKIEQEEEQNVSESKMRVQSKSQIASEIVLP